jgi:hypothetical protein
MSCAIGHAGFAQNVLFFVPAAQCPMGARLAAESRFPGGEQSARSRQDAIEGCATLPASTDKAKELDILVKLAPCRPRAVSLGSHPLLVVLQLIAARWSRL